MTIDMSNWDYANDSIFKGCRELKKRAKEQENQNDSTVRSDTRAVKDIHKIIEQSSKEDDEGR